MFIQRLRVDNLRCIEQAEMRPCKQLNFLVGDNASGKTSLLEAIYVLGRGQSFRQGSLASLVRKEAQSMLIYAETLGENDRRNRLGFLRDQAGTRFKLNGEAVHRLSQVATALPLQAIDPNVHRLLEEGPNHRRKFLDWGVFHVEHDFYAAWRNYMQVLRQRNAALRSRQSKADVIVWDAQLIQWAERVNGFRQQYVSELAPLIRHHAEDILGDVSLEIRFSTGWPLSNSFGESLTKNLSKDMEIGHTQSGPHRSDLKIRAGGRVARDMVSRGQQKVITIAMLFAQADLFYSRCGETPIILVDDLAAELGSEYRRKLLAKMGDMGGQYFLSFLSESDIPESSANVGTAMFHVEHGEIA